MKYSRISLAGFLTRLIPGVLNAERVDWLGLFNNLETVPISLFRGVSVFV